MSRTISGDDLGLDLFDADLLEWEQAWVEDQFAAIIALSWPGEPPPPTSPGRVPARWNEPGRSERPGLRRWPSSRRLVATRHARQRSPPTTS